MILCDKINKQAAIGLIAYDKSSDIPLETLLKARDEQEKGKPETTVLKKSKKEFLEKAKLVMSSSDVILIYGDCSEESINNKASEYHKKGYENLTRITKNALHPKVKQLALVLPGDPL